ncbi:Flp pilus assembly protein CpaB [Paramagnetospirillum kuznetsovii]|nr:Flp pilus assembly protein CpaB [Paramagnetospirillum kuznetsovii]
MVIVLAVAAFAALLTGFLAKMWLDRQAQVRPAAEAAVTEVLVTAHDIAPGTVMSASDLRYEPWPNAVVTPRLMVRRPGEDLKAQVVGQVARRALAEGEPFSMAATFRAESAGVLAGILGPGMRAVSIAITNPTAVSGFVTPGDKVDVLLATDVSKTVDSTERKSGGALIMRYAAETVLSDVKVLAIDQQIVRTRDGAAIQGKTATLEVTPKQAELVTTAGMIGNLQLVLRGLPGSTPAAPAEETDQIGFTSDTETSKALQVLGDFRQKPAKPSGGGTAAPSVLINRAGQVTSEGFER